MMPSEERLRGDLSTFGGSLSRNGDFGPHTGQTGGGTSAGVLLARAALAMAVLSLVLALSMSVGVVAAGAGIWWYRLNQQQGIAVLPPVPAPVRPIQLPVQPVAPVPAQPVTAPEPQPAAPVQANPAPVQANPAPVSPAPVSPAPVSPAPVPKAEPRPQPVIVPGPEPAPETPPAEEPPAVREQKLTISSVPLGADVFLDGKLIGRTPLIGFSVPEGSHQVKMVSDSETLVRTIDVGRRNPVRYVWKGGETWEIHF
jgi:hypothetical protein